MIYRADVILFTSYMSEFEPHRRVVHTLMDMQWMWKGHVIYVPHMIELRKSSEECNKPNILSTYWKTSWGAKRAIASCADYVTVKTARVTEVDYMLFDNYIKYSLARSMMEEFEERESVLV